MSNLEPEKIHDLLMQTEANYPDLTHFCTHLIKRLEGEKAASDHITSQPSYPSYVEQLKGSEGLYPLFSRLLNQHKQLALHDEAELEEKPRTPGLK